MTDVLDLTNSHLRDLSSVGIAPTLTALDLTANRLETLDPRVQALTGLCALNLRQNIIADAASVNCCQCKGALQDLELRDNLLTAIPTLEGFSKLTRLEFSYNQIRSLAPLSSLAAEPASSPPLVELFVAANKVTAIEALGGFSQLTVLELGSNRIRTIEGLEGQASLLELWLGRNRISKIENLGHLTALRRISLQSNRLENMSGIAACSSLVELYLSHNGIWCLDKQLTQLMALRVLDVSNNRISKVEHLQGLSRLEDLWLNDNQIPSLEGMQQALQDQVESLTTIYLENNPAASAPDYKQRMLALLPKLQQLDANVLPERD
ncbi:hypothetical protein COO60DRAFT_1528850 [Scenedesmus sp. NREL 46B-D3]|nr:hypothetical protein COO60DRAFT_1528850 [Scenedesmus sp. NREL 46B-D3]